MTAKPITDQLQQDMECDRLLETIHGLTELDRACYQVLIESATPLTVDEIADNIDRERSTAYRSIQRLCQTGIVQKDQVNYDHGGYYHVYHPIDPVVVAGDMQRLLNDWYAKMGQLIREFENTYGSVPVDGIRVEE